MLVYIEFVFIQSSDLRNYISSDDDDNDDDDASLD